MPESRKLRSSCLPQIEAYVDLSLLDGGSFIGDLSKVHAGASGRFRMYNWAFLVSHQGTHVLWDVSHVGPKKPLVQQLAEKGVLPRQIDAVLFR
jgi:hypothetical protein